MTTQLSAITDAFEARTIDTAAFGHRDHVGVACGMLSRYSFLDAAYKYAHGIREMAEKAGAPEKFNATITLAFMGLIAERVQTCPHDTFDEFLEKNPDLLEKSMLEKWYSVDRLRSSLARQVFLMPDRAQTAY